MHSETAASSQERHNHMGRCLKSGILKGKVDIRAYKWGKALTLRKRSVGKVWSKTLSDNRKNNFIKKILDGIFNFPFWH